MPGFLISDFTERANLVNVGKYCVQKELGYGKYWAKWNTLDKYMQDKLFEETDKYILILEGVLLNKKELCEKYNAELSIMVQKAFEQNGDSFMKEFRGSFSGAIYEKSRDRWIVFIDQISTKPLYYYFGENDIFACGTQINYVTDTLKSNGIERTVDEHGLSCMLLYGNFMDECTGVSEVKRLFPGEYITIQGNKRDIHVYYQLGIEKKIGLSEEEYIENLDLAFKKAVSLMIAKDEEYGYRTILDISGGVDSRMIAFTAKEEGSNNPILLSYSQSGGREQKIAQQVANILGDEFYFKSLDNGSCLLKIDESVLLNNGSAVYMGISGGKEMLKLLNHDDFGLELTGLLGDMFDGSMTHLDGEEKPYVEYAQFRFGSVLPYDEQTYSNVLNRYENNELFWYYIRGMICGMSSFPVRQNYVEPMAPFGYPEFMETYLSIPWEIRVKGKLLRKWMVTKQPEAAKIPYSATGVSIYDEFTTIGKIKQIWKFFWQEVHRQLHQMHKGYSMVPVDYWYQSYPKIAAYMQEYYMHNKERVSGNIREKIDRLMEEGTPAIDKSLALTALSYVKQFIDNNE